MEIVKGFDTKRGLFVEWIVQALIEKEKGHRFREDLLNSLRDGKRKKLTDIGFGFTGNLGFSFGFS